MGKSCKSPGCVLDSPPRLFYGVMPEAQRVISSDAIQALVTRAAGGEADALEGLIVLSHGRLLGFARRMIGPEWVGKIDAEDVLQDAYAAMYRDLAQCRAENLDAFLAWAREVIRNRFIDSARRARRAKRSVVGEQRWQVLHELIARLERDRPSVSAGLQREDLRAALMACLARLPEQLRASSPRCIDASRRRG